MAHTRQWRVDIFLYEDEAEVAADAVLHADIPEGITARGTGRLSLVGTVPEIGAELAAARALSELGHRMLQLASDDLAALPSTPAR
jgi:hypothetical protein